MTRKSSGSRQLIYKTVTDSLLTGKPSDDVTANEGRRLLHKRFDEDKAFQRGEKTYYCSRGNETHRLVKALKKGSQIAQKSQW